MGFRFRKGIKILPGVRVNLGLDGVSTTVGRRGASVNIGKRGARGIVGVPGTGMSYTERLSGGTPAVAPGQREIRAGHWFAWTLFAVVVLMAVLALSR